MGRQWVSCGVVIRCVWVALGMRKVSDACALQLSTAHCFTRVCMASNLWRGHSMCVGGAMDAETERSRQGEGEIS